MTSHPDPRRRARAAVTAPAGVAAALLTALAGVAALAGCGSDAGVGAASCADVIIYDGAVYEAVPAAVSPAVLAEGRARLRGPVLDAVRPFCGDTGTVPDPQAGPTDFLASPVEVRAVAGIDPEVAVGAAGSGGALLYLRRGAALPDLSSTPVSASAPASGAASGAGDPSPSGATP